MTPNSATVPYLLPADFLLRRDVTAVFQYCTDGYSTTGQGLSPIQMAAILADPTTMQGMVLIALLGDASGMLESALLRSNRYSVGSIQGLLLQGGNSAGYLKRILGDLAMYAVMTRRSGPAPPEAIVAAYNEATKALNDLSDGIRIFAFAEIEQAGLPQTNQFSEADYYNNNLFTVRSRPMFGSRGMDRRNQVI